MPGRLRAMSRRGVWLRLRGIPAPLAVLLLLALVESAAWNAATPAFQGPDESSHFAYAQYVAETGAKPSPTHGLSGMGTELLTAMGTAGLQGTIANEGARPAWTSADEALYRAAVAGFGREQRANGNGPNSQAQNPPTYYYLQAIPYRIGLLLGADVFTRLALMRALNSLFLLITVAAVWLLAGEVFSRRRWLQAVATAAVVLQPELAFLGGVVNPDSMLIATFSVAMWLAVRIIRRGPTPGRAAALAGACAAACLTHGRGLAVLPALVVVMSLALWRHRPPRAFAVRTVAPAAGILAVAALVLFLVTVGAGGGAAYGGEVGRVTTGNAHPFDLGGFLSNVWQFYLPRLSFQGPRLGPDFGFRQVWVETFYGTFGSLDTRFQAPTYDKLQTASILGLIALAVAAVVLRSSLRRWWAELAALASFFFAELFLLHFDSYRHLLINPSDPIITGRYLLPLIGLFGLAVAFAVGALPRRAGPVVAGAVLALGVVLELGGLGLTVDRFYV